MFPVDQPLFVLPASFESKRAFRGRARIDVDEKGIARDDRRGQRRLRWIDINRFVKSRGDVVAFTDGAGGQLGIPTGIKDQRLLLDIVQERLVDAYAFRVRRSVHGPTADVPFYQPRIFAWTIVGTLLVVSTLASWWSLWFYVEALFAMGSTLIYVATLPHAVVIGPKQIELRSRLRRTRFPTAAIRSVALFIVEGRGPIVGLELADGGLVELRAYGASTLAIYDRLRQVTALAADAAPAHVVERRFDRGPALGFVAAAAGVFLLVFLIPFFNGRAVSEGARFLPVPVVAALIHLGTPIDTMDFEGRTATYNAAKFGKIEMLRMLLANGADPARQQSRHPGFTALHVASEYNQIEAVRILLGAGVSPNVRNNWQQTPLMQLATNGHREPPERAIAEMLIAAGADLNAKDFQGFTLAHLADQPDVMWLIELLGRHGADLDALNQYQERPLDRALRDRKPYYVRALAEAGADIEFLDSAGYRPLSAAAKLGHLETVKMLVDAGAQVDASSDTVSTALRVAVTEGHGPIVSLLLERGASPSATFNSISALQRAIVNKRTDMARQLIAAGADLRYESDEAGPALFLAADTSNLELVDVLLRAGADPNHAYRGRFTALMAARRYRNEAIEELLLSRGATR